MKKSTVIAACLFSSSIVTQLEDGEEFVKEVFERQFPAESFLEWNQEIPDSTAEGLIRNAGQGIQIDVMQFIEDLRAIS